MTRTAATRVRASRPVRSLTGTGRRGAPEMLRIRWAGNGPFRGPVRPAGISGRVPHTRTTIDTPAARSLSISPGAASSRASRTTGQAGRRQPTAASRIVSATQSLSVPPPGAEDAARSGAPAAG